MVSSDLATPLFGPVLRLQKDLPVMGKERGSSRNEPGSEWPGLEYSNWLLGKHGPCDTSKRTVDGLRL